MTRSCSAPAEQRSDEYPAAHRNGCQPFVSQAHTSHSSASVQYVLSRVRTRSDIQAKYNDVIGRYSIMRRLNSKSAREPVRGGIGGAGSAGVVENYGKNTFCELVRHVAFGCYNDTRCYGSVDPVFARYRTRLTTQELTVLKHEIRSDLAVFGHRRSIAVPSYQPCITCFAKPAPVPLPGRAAEKQA